MISMQCPLCSTKVQDRLDIETQEAGRQHRCQAWRCRECGLVFLDDFAADRSAIYGDDYTVWGRSSESDEPVIAESKRAAFRGQLRSLLAHAEPAGKKLLDVGTGRGYLLEVARDMGFDVHGLDISAYAAGKAGAHFPGRIFRGQLAEAGYADASFDVVTMTDLLEHISDPMALLAEVKRILKPGGLLFIITPNTDSLTRKVLGRRWFQFKHEHVIYWNRGSLLRLLREFSLQPLLARNNRKRFSLAYYQHYFRKYSLLGGFSQVFLALYPLLPRSLQNLMFDNPVTGEILLIARK
jgi:2-polyprenyl-3-methyl-5-hydroxy-6-metoxy-1,4-benzoquinol methylase